ncbi:MAG: class I SAM-dependent methyltransferase [Roseiarcus sp.]
MSQVGSTRSLNRYDRFMRKRAAGAGSGSSASDPVRLQKRYEMIYSRNRELFKGARVLDLMSATGFWSLAALDAGAAHVSGVEVSPAAVETAKKAFTEYGVNAGAYRFINSEIPAALRKFDPKAFDVVLCHGFLEQSDPRFVFQQLSRLRPKHVVLDTRMVQGKGPIVRFRARSSDESKVKAADRYKSILAIPNHELITFFCDYFQFRWRQVDWKAGITDWSGLGDYEQERRRTYLLERAAADPAPAPR